MKFKLLQRFYDKVEGKYYEPSTEFVEFPNHVADRLNVLGESVAIKTKEDDKPASPKVKAKTKPKD